MNYWLLKSEPETYSFADLVREKIGHWDGVRNFQARNFLRQMKKSDLALFYNSGKNPAVVGLIEIMSEAYPDPTANEGDWSQVDVKPIQEFKNRISLAEIKSDPLFQGLLLIKQSRLSVMPITEKHFRHFLKRGGLK